MHHVHFAQTDSTNRRAAALAAEHVGEVLLVSADEQAAGRGRMDRQWQSPCGGAWFTFVWPCHKPAPHYEAVPLVAGLAVCETLEQMLGQPLQGLALKWPNDVLIDGKKLAGILCERTLVGQATPVPLLIGIGINVNNATADLPPGLRRPPIALCEVTDTRHDVVELIQLVAEQLQQQLTVFEERGQTEEMADAIQRRLCDA